MNAEALGLPVSIGQRIVVVPKERAKTDYFTKVSGFVVFIKEVPDDCEGVKVIIKVTAVKEKYGFAVFEKRC